jgi:M penetrans paralogue family 26
MSENDKYRPDYQAPENNGDNNGNNNNPNSNENRNTNVNDPYNQNQQNQNQQNQQYNQGQQQNQGQYNYQDPMSQQINNIGNPYNQNVYQQKIPNGEAVLVLGIISIVASFCYGFIGLILGIIALILASSANKTYLMNPNVYSLASYNNLKAGKVCAIIGVVLGSLIILSVIIFFGAIFGMAGAASVWR